MRFRVDRRYSDERGVVDRPPVTAQALILLVLLLVALGFVIPRSRTWRPVTLAVVVLVLVRIVGAV